MASIMPTDASDWSITPIATRDGVDLVLTIPTLSAGPVTLSIDRAEGRAFANAILAAAGDATHRTFPRPQLQEAVDG